MEKKTRMTTPVPQVPDGVRRGPGDGKRITHRRRDDNGVKEDNGIDGDNDIDGDEGIDDDNGIGGHNDIHGDNGADGDNDSDGAHVVNDDDWRDRRPLPDFVISAKAMLEPGRGLTPEGRRKVVHDLVDRMSGSTQLLFSEFREIIRDLSLLAEPELLWYAETILVDGTYADSFDRAEQRPFHRLMYLLRWLWLRKSPPSTVSEAMLIDLALESYKQVMLLSRNLWYERGAPTKDEMANRATCEFQQKMFLHYLAQLSSGRARSTGLLGAAWARSVARALCPADGGGPTPSE